MGIEQLPCPQSEIFWLRTIGRENYESLVRWKNGQTPAINDIHYAAFNSDNHTVPYSAVRSPLQTYEAQLRGLWSYESYNTALDYSPTADFIMTINQAENHKPLVVDLCGCGSPFLDLPNGASFTGLSIGLQDYLQPEERTQLKARGANHLNLNINEDSTWDALYEEAKKSYGVSLLFFRPLAGYREIDKSFGNLINRMNMVWHLLRPGGTAFLQYPNFTYRHIVLLNNSWIRFLDKQPGITARGNNFGFSITKAK